MIAERSTLTALDDDTLIHVFSFLDIGNILTMRKVCPEHRTAWKADMYL